MNGSLLGGLGGQGSAARERYPSPACMDTSHKEKGNKANGEGQGGPRSCQEASVVPSKQSAAGGHCGHSARVWPTVPSHGHSGHSLPARAGGARKQGCGSELSRKNVESLTCNVPEQVVAS